MARRILRDKADAEDAVQDAYLSALTHSDQFEGRSSPLTWITKILINQGFSQLRYKIRQPLAVAVGFDEVESLVSVADENRPMKDTSKPGQRKIGQDISAPVARTGNHMKARRHGTKPYAFLSTRQAGRRITHEPPFTTLHYGRDAVTVTFFTPCNSFALTRSANHVTLIPVDRSETAQK